MNREKRLKMENHKKETGPPKWEFIAGGVLILLLISGSIGILADDLGKDGKEITLEEAASAGDVKKIQALLDKGVDVNGRDSEGITPLHRAAGAGRLKAVELLVAQHAEVNGEDNEGETALFWGAGGGHLEVV